MIQNTFQIVNVQATIGKHFLFHGVIPKAANGLDIFE
jgi:hypothetical protein